MSIIRIIHALPDRVRLKVPAIVNEQTAQRIEEKAKGLEGIHWMRANAKCSGLVVRFDASKHSHSGLVDMVHRFVAEGVA